MLSRLPLGIRSRILSLALALGSGIVHAGSDDTLSRLVQQGQFWQSQDKPKRAAEIWSKVLLLNAVQPDALYGLGAMEVKAGKLEKAGEYLARLQAIQPLPRQALQLEQDIRLSDPDKQQKLEEARLLVDKGEREQAAALYRQLLAGRPGQGLIGREYYNNLAFTRNNWVEARAGFERLVREHPDDPYAALFLAKHLVRRQDTRTEGIHALAKLSRRADIGGDADESWRLALTWMGPPSKSQVPLFEAFLKVHPNDQEIRTLLNKGYKQGNAQERRPRDLRVTLGFQALEHGNQAVAEREFSAQLKTLPNDADALGGLGVLRQQQNRLDEAERLLEKAVHQKNGAVWSKPLAEVHYWALLQRAHDSRAAGDPAVATEQLKQAIHLKPDEMAGYLALADLQAEQSDYSAAEVTYRQALLKRPGDIGARRGLIAVLGQLGRQNEAARLLDELPPAEQEKAAFRQLRADLARQRALEAGQRNDAVGQRMALEEAGQLAPESAWVHLDLARLLVREGEADKARRLMDELESRYPNNADMHHASALLSVGLLDWQKAGESLARIPVKVRTPDIRQLVSEVNFSRQLQEARTLSNSGRLQEARTHLAGLEPLAVDQPSRMAALAWAYADAGEPHRGLDLMRGLLIRSPASEDARLQLEVATLALRAGNDFFVEQALQRALSLAPDDPVILARAARLYRQQGHSVKAVELLHRAVAQEQQGTSGLTSLHTTEAAKALDDLLQERSAFLVQGPTVRSNNSESGLGRLTDIELPFEANIPFGDDRLALRITPVRLDAGSISSNAARRFGDGPLASAAYPGRSPGSQVDNGIGLAVAFENQAKGFKADLGSTPLGFLYSTVVGGISVRRPFAEIPELSWGLQISRRAVTNSLLSFAGAEDDRTGRKWGAVTSNGGRLELGYDNRRVGAYAYGGWHSLMGSHVEHNSSAELGAGAYHYLRNELNQQINIGLSLTGITYDKNQNHFTYGNGGYFSPQTFLAASFPVSWAQRTERWSIWLRGSLGIQFIDQDASNYFPSHAAMQAEASRILGYAARYQGDKSTNVGYSLAGAAEYRLSSHFVVGGRLSMDNSQDWRQWDGGLYLRYLFEDSSRPLELPVNSYRSPYSNL